MKEVKRYQVQYVKEDGGWHVNDGETVDTEMVRAEDFDAVVKELQGKLKVAVEALNCLYPGLVIDLRYASDDDDKDALRSRVAGIEEALAQIGDGEGE